VVSVGPGQGALGGTLITDEQAPRVLFQYRHAAVTVVVTVMRWLRAAVHVHSDWSYDGVWSLRRITDVFSRLRYYDIVLMVEHDQEFSAGRWRAYRQACREASSRVLLIPGIEYQDPENVTHIMVWGTKASFLGQSQPTMDILRGAADEQSVAIFAHPRRRGASDRFDARWVPLLSGVETWNRKYDGVAPNRVASKLAASHGLPPVAGLDLHTGRQLFPLAVEIGVDGVPAEDTLLGAMHAGMFRTRVLGLPAKHLDGGAGGAIAGTLQVVNRSLSRGLRILAGATRSAGSPS
jgi:hypothetical protein